MKAEIIASLEKLLETEDIFVAQKEFKKLSASFKALKVEKPAEAQKQNDKASESTGTTDGSAVSEGTTAGADEAAQAETSSSKGEQKHSESELPTETPAPADTQTVEESLPTAENSAVEDTTPKAESPEAEDEKKDGEMVEATHAEVPTDASAPQSTDDASLKAQPEATAQIAAEQGAETTEEPTKEAPVSNSETQNTESEKEEVQKVQQPPSGSAPETSAQEPGEAVDASEAKDNDPLDARFHELSELFKLKIKEAKAAKQKIEEETLAKAKDLLGELETLVTKEENIGKAFSGFNAIREHWKALPKVSNDDYRDLNVEYNKLAEQFFYNINIYKELKELDLKHNLEQKNLVLADQKKLIELNDIRLLEVEVRMNQERWNEIGPTFKEEWEKLKDDFWTTTRTIYSKIQAFYDQRRAEFEKNLEAKKNLLEEVKRIAALELKSPKKWQEKTKDVIEFQKQWKMIGFVPKEKAGPIWKEFRKTCDAFFEKKRAHFAEIHAVHEANKLAKEKLVLQAEQHKDSTEWSETSSILIKLQNDWKKIGPAHQRDDNALWRRFRQACDHFFTARNAQKHGEVAEQAENLVKKKAIIAEVEAHKPGTDQDKNIADLKAFGEKWRSVGHVPFKEKDSVNKAYKKAMDAQFDALKIERKARQKMQFEEKVENLKEARGGDRLLQKEEDHLRNKISKLNAEINQYENNMGFFANSKGADKLKEEVLKKIDSAKGEIKELKEQLTMLRNA